VIARIPTATVSGIDGIKIDVEVDIAYGLPAFNIVGLPEASVKESKERVRSAIKNAGFEFPGDRITINLAPADVRKEDRPSTCP
jgi:magnesium chelatase family protein